MPKRRLSEPEQVTERGRGQGGADRAGSKRLRLKAAIAGAILLLGSTGAAALYEAPGEPHASPVLKIMVGEGHGSGVHIGNGFVLTAWHVASIAQPTLKTDKGEKIEAEVLWSSWLYDVALLRISSGKRPTKAALSCSLAAIGDPISIAGNPFDNEFITTRGYIVSGITDKGDSSHQNFPGWHEVILADATSGPGNSGGPVFDSAGRVIGILVGGYQIPLAIIVPSSTVCRLLARA